MRVVMISKALVVGAYHRKLEELVSLGVQLRLILPHRWGSTRPELTHAQNYDIVSLPVLFTGRNHFHLYRGLRDAVIRFRPDILHVDEEPYSAITYQAMRIAKARNIPALFFAWQNIVKRYPPPFSWIEQYNFRASRVAIAGNEEAKEVLRTKGFEKSIAVIPQFGVDPDLFKRQDASELKRRLFGTPRAVVVGFGGRLVEEKGVMLLLEAFANLPAEVFLLLIGDGPLREVLTSRASQIGVAERVRIVGTIPSKAMPEYLNCLTCLVLPSLTRPNWKEQFGRILIEAMACEVPVIGSSSAEIPNVIGDAGLIVPEGNVRALTEALQRLLNKPEEREAYARKGRAWVMKHFTQRIVAEHTYQVYRQMLGI